MRERLNMDGFVVPALSVARQRQLEEEQSDFKKHALLKNVWSLLLTSLVDHG